MNYAYVAAFCMLATSAIAADYDNGVANDATGTSSGSALPSGSPGGDTIPYGGYGAVGKEPGNNYTNPSANNPPLNIAPLNEPRSTSRPRITPRSIFRRRTTPAEYCPHQCRAGEQPAAEPAALTEAVKRPGVAKPSHHKKYKSL